MNSPIHDDVKAALDELQEEAHDLEQVAGHELVKLFNALRVTTQAIRASRRGQEFEPPEIRAGAGAIEDPLHPETAAAEARPETAEEVEARAAREPDPGVAEKVRASAPSDAGELSGEPLDKRAAELDIEGRSQMTADEKREAVAKAEATKAEAE